MLPARSFAINAGEPGYPVLPEFLGSEVPVAKCSIPIRVRERGLAGPP
jgi:hypothetical protein